MAMQALPGRNKDCKNYSEYRKVQNSLVEKSNDKQPIFFCIQDATKII